MTGSHVPAPLFPDDDGSADPRLAAALAAHAAGSGDPQDVLAALAAARVLVPVVAIAVEEEVVTDGPAAGLRQERTTDMAVVTLHGKDGRTALPLFTSLATLAAWDPQARPVGVDATRAALSAAAEGADVLVLDVAGPVTYVVEGPAVRRLAEGDPMLPAHADPAVRAALAELLADTPGVTAGWLVPADGVDARLLIQVADPDDAAAVSAAARSLAERLKHADAVRRVVTRGLDLALLPAGATPPADPLFAR
ncbi:MAG TPA: SseB family protein [Motilibacteraceae bacterium]|nr:SseB family protein [Motilibacteraceae bacterium]